MAKVKVVKHTIPRFDRISTGDKFKYLLLRLGRQLEVDVAGDQLEGEADDDEKKEKGSHSNLNMFIIHSK